MAPTHWSLPNNLQMPSKRERERFSVHERTRETGEGWGRTDLDCLAALLRVGQQLDGKCPRVLQRLLEVDEAVAPMPAQRTLTTDGHRTGVTVQMQHLQTRGHTAIKERFGTSRKGQTLGALWIPDPQPTPSQIHKHIPLQKEGAVQSM